MIKFLERFLRDGSGAASTAEYVLILAIVGIGIVGYDAIVAMQAAGS